MCNKQKPLVSICCLTYNHAPYIRECLDGFIMQQTSFPFEVLVHDDASTDGTQDIIREYEAKYPDIMKPIYQTENQYSKGVKVSLTYNFSRAQGKYIALCEGDDYWTDPLKLQKQVDFLESHPECSLTYHACKNIFEDGLTGWICGEDVKEEYDAVGIFPYAFQTATTMFKKEVVDSDIYKKTTAINLLDGDMKLYLSASVVGKLMGVNEVCSVYRRNRSSISLTMHDDSHLYERYIGWSKISKLFGKDVSKFLANDKLKEFILSAFLKRDIIMLVKMYVVGLYYNPQVIVTGSKGIMNLIKEKIMATSL